MTIDKVFVPPIKIQGIKTKIVPFIKENLKCLNLTDFDDWGVMNEF